MATIIPSDYTPIDLNAEQLNTEADEMELSRERILAQMLDLTEAHQQFLTNYQGISSAAYKNAMLTLYGKSNCFVDLQLGSAVIFRDYSKAVLDINADALTQASMEGETK